MDGFDNREADKEAESRAKAAAARERLLDSLRRRVPVPAGSLSRHTAKVGLVKKILPVVAILLLVALAAAPSLRFGPDANRVIYKVATIAGHTPMSRMMDAKYHGIDQHGQPFTLTANAASDQGAGNLALEQPEGDITLNSGAWLVLKSDTGMFHQHSQLLGLAGNVTLYRNDGTILNVARAQIDLRKGDASSKEAVQVQGAFGTLNAANGFSITGRGSDIVFKGPATLVLANVGAAALAP
jgi:lipopolysaccharide export system protein LptC